MYSDSLTFNQNPLPPDKSSLFKMLIQSQDEVFIGNKTFFAGNVKDKKIGTPIIQKSFEQDKAFCTSIFENKKAPIQNINAKPLNHIGYDWIFFTLLLCLLLIVIINFTNRKRVAFLFKAFIVPRFTNQLTRDGSIQKEFFTYPMLLIYFISFSLFIFKGLMLFFHVSPNLFNGLIIFGVLVIYYIGKFLLVAILGFVFKTKKETFEYTTNTLIFLVVSGMFLVPLVFLVYYMQTPFSIIFFYITIVIGAIMLLYRTFRGFLIGLNSEHYNLYYLLLYLCTVEILPLLISVKLLMIYYLSRF